MAAPWAGSAPRCGDGGLGHGGEVLLKILREGGRGWEAGEEGGSGSMAPEDDGWPQKLNRMKYDGGQPMRVDEG